MATINTVQKSLHLPLSGLATPRTVQLLCSASVGNTENPTTLTLQLRDASAATDTSQPTTTNTAAAAASPNTNTTTGGSAATGTATLAPIHAASTLENALTIGYPDPDMLADVLGVIQTASLKNNNNNNNSSSSSLTSSNYTDEYTNTVTTTTTNAATGPTESNIAAGISSNSNLNKITITRRNTTNTNYNNNTNNNNNNNSNNNNNNNYTKDNSKIILHTNNNNNNNSSSSSSSSALYTHNGISSSSGTSSSGNHSGGKSNTTSYIKNCLIRSSSCSNTATNVSTLAQIMSNSSTSSASTLLHNNHNSNSNCSSNSNFSNSSNTSSSNSDSSLSLSSLHSHLGVGLVNFKSGVNNHHNNNNNNNNNNNSNNNNSNHYNNINNIKTVTLTTTTSHATTNNNKISNSTSLSTANTTTTSSSVKKHRPKLSSPTRHGPQQCQICSKIFGNASALAKHKLTHSDERKYICTLCSKAFKRQDHLNGHMMTHRNKKPYECKAEGCGKSYCDARSLRRHTENHHAGIVTPQHHQHHHHHHHNHHNNSNNNKNNNINNNNNNNTSNNSSSQSHSSTQTLSPTANATGATKGNGISLSLSPATASGDASSPDGATCIRTYISNGGTVVDAATGIALTEEQIKAINLPIKTGVTLLSPTTSTSSTASSTSSCSTGGGSTVVSVSAASPTITLADGATIEAEGLTREQLDLISKIMHQTKQTSAQVTVSSSSSVNSYKINTEAATQQSSRPRTWNMQLLNNSQNVSITVDDATGEMITSSSSPIDSKDEELNQQLVATLNPQLLNIVKLDQKPVECNLCHRKFKNIPALNGHMRLHGGYFKKDPETKKNEKKESSGPPLQTASIGVRALIEEKIISKRSKDLNKGAFVVPAPPGSIANTTTIRRSISDLESFLNPKANSASVANNVATSTTTALLPAATTIKNANGLSIQQIGLPPSIEIFSSKSPHQKTLNLGTGPNTLTITTNNITTTPTTATLGSLTAINANNLGLTTATKSKGTSTDPKDSTLIELLKRGTRIAVTSKKTPQSHKSTNMLQQQQPQQQQQKQQQLQLQLGNEIHTTTLPITTTATGSRQIITNNNHTVIIPSDVQVVSTKCKAVGGSSLARNATPASISLADGTPLSLTIAPSSDSSVGNVYTVTYTSDSAGLFEDAEVYNVSDTEMLLQTVDTMELLSADNEATHIKSEHSDDYTLVSEQQSESNLTTNLIKVESEANCMAANDHNNCNIITTKTTAVAAAAATTTTALPTFQQFHSKEYIMQNSSQIQAITSMRANTLTLPADLKHQLGVLGSPLHSPLAYPTPPSSHENAAQSSPFIEDGQQYVESTNTFFGDKCPTDYTNVYFKTSDNDDDVDVGTLTDNEKILKLKSVLEESAFDASIKVEDLLNTTEDGTACDLREFAETNLSFLDEDQEFLNDSGNATSPLSESFFTSGIGTAEEVKEVLREVLPDENMQLTSEQQGNIIDLYYLPGLSLQSQMMPNSEDPLLSSSPREFGQQRQMQLQQLTAQQPTGEQLQGTVYAQQIIQQQEVPQQQQQQSQQQIHNEFIMTMAGSNSNNNNNNNNNIVVSGINTNSIEQLGNIQNLLPLQNQTQYVNVTHLSDLGQQQQNSSETIVMQQSQQQQMNAIDAAMLQPIIYTGNTGSATSASSTTITTDTKQELNVALQHAANVGINFLPTEYNTTTTTNNNNNNNNNSSSSNTTNNSNNASNQQHQLQQQEQQLLSNVGLQFGSLIAKSTFPLQLAPIATPTPTPTPTPPPTPTLLANTTSTVISTLQPLSNQTNSILKRRLRPNGSHDANAHNFSKFHTLSPYRSKLRKPSRTHFTPAPILNPDRKGVGLYCKVRKDLGQGMLSFDNFDDDFDDPVGLVDFSDESKVNLGSAYQAQIPANKISEDISRNAHNAIDESVGAELMWDPSVQADDQIVMRYIDLSKSSAVPLGSHSEEVALHTLLKAEGKLAAAVLTLLQTPSSSFQMKWTAHELEIFLKGLEKHGKDFGKIATELQTKTPGECVQIYYFWKKLCVDYKVSHLKAEPVPLTPTPAELKPYVCEIPDCSASFSSKAALHGHTRIHTFGRNANNQHTMNNSAVNNNNSNNNNNNNNNNSNNCNTNSNASAQSLNNQQHSNHNNGNGNGNGNGSNNNTNNSQSNHAQHQTNNNNNNMCNTINIAAGQQQTKDANNQHGRELEFPCKVCGKVFNKVKSRSAHMKTHRVQDPEQQQQQQQTQLSHNQSQSQSQSRSHNQNSNPNQHHHQSQNQLQHTHINSAITMAAVTQQQPQTA